MLKKLVIEQFVIIDKLDLDFRPGLTVLTGETGAGKSILLDAVGLVLGDPDNPELIRRGSPQALIEATLSPPEGSPVWSYLSENGFVSGPQQEIVIRRTLSRNGRNESLLNGKDISLDVLKKAGILLAEIHGQFANQTLLDPDNQLHLLDLSGNFPPEVFKNVADALHNVERLTKELEEENTFIARHRDRLRQIQKHVDLLAKLGMREGFVDEVRAEYKRLLIAKETGFALQSILAQFIAGNGALKALNTANQIFDRQENLVPEKVVKLSEWLKGALEQSRNAVSEMERLAAEYDIDTRPLRQYEETLTALKRISDESKVEIENLNSYYEDLVATLKRVQGGREAISRLNKELIAAQNAYRDAAHVLSEHRVAAAKALSEAVTVELPPLKLMRAAFVVEVKEKTDIPWTERGLNVVTFTARMNAGQDFSPISETASGGELVRLVLALKVVLQTVQPSVTLIFDEVDTGIGGAAAAAVGERIAQLADLTQVLVITHSPQVASRGNQHLSVSKRTEGETTLSVVNTLSPPDRIEEISRMLAGDQTTVESHAAAKSLIDEASTAAESRRRKREA